MEQPKDWYDVDDILYDGKKEDIENIVCPDCGGKIKYRYGEESNSFEVSCHKCGHLSRAHGSPIPNCVTFFGNEYDFAV